MGVTTKKKTKPITIGDIIFPSKIPNLIHNLFKNVNKKIAAGIGLSYLMNTSFQQIFPVPLLFSINLSSI